MKRARLTQGQLKAIFAKMKRAKTPYVSAKTVRVDPHGKRLDIQKDRKHKAMHGGKRESADGNIYYEKRANRSDVNDYDRRKTFKNKESEWL